MKFMLCVLVWTLILIILRYLNLLLFSISLENFLDKINFCNTFGLTWSILFFQATLFSGWLTCIQLILSTCMLSVFPHAGRAWKCIEQVEHYLSGKHLFFFLFFQLNFITDLENPSSLFSISCKCMILLIPIPG